METVVSAKVGALLNKGLCCLLLLFSFCFILSGCASSNVSREAAGNMDIGMQNARDLADGAGETNIADSYQNSSQAAKGALIGGAAGGIIGAFSNGIGFIPGAATGAIIGASYGSYIDSNETLEDKLQNRGATLVVLGDQVLIVMPSVRLFDPWTPKIKPQAYSTIALISQYINSYAKMLVKVSAYTDRTGARSVDMALSQQQAESIAKMLLASGVDARILYAVGCGGSHLVTTNTGNWDNDNYRIEITLEKLHV